MDLIQQLLEARERQKVTRKALAASAGLTYMTIYKTELGQTSISLNNLQRWADVLGFEVRLVRKPKVKEQK